MVTGASGQLGSSLVKSLVELGNNVRIFDLPKSNHPFLNGLKIEKVYGDITIKEDVYRAMKDCDFVYHLAGCVSYRRSASKKIFDVNCNGTQNVLETAKKLKIKKLVVTASTAGIGIPENIGRPLSERSRFDEKWKRISYMYSKYLTIQLCKDAAKDGLDVVIVSPTTIYGQGDTAMHIGSFIKHVKKGMIFAPPGGNSVVSVDDCVEGHILAMKHGEKGENYILANEFLRYKEMMDMIAEVVGAKPVRYVIPFWWQFVSVPFFRIIENAMSVFGLKPFRVADSWLMRFKFRYFDSSKARKFLHWKPSVDFKESIKKAVDFYTQHGLI